jgi:hypothetical protein
MSREVRHSYHYRCTGAQAACDCGFRGPVHKKADRHRRARADLKAHAAEVRAGTWVKPDRA